MSIASAVFRSVMVLLCVMVSTSCSAAANGDHAAPARDLPRPALDLPAPRADEHARTAVFAAGCFWCTQAVFENVKGVSDVTAGYAGGTAGTANYEHYM